MGLTPSQKPAREWPLLILTIGLVGAICFPLWQMFPAEDSDVASPWSEPSRWAKLLLGPEQIVNYCCFLWAVFIIATRYWEVNRQRQAFALDLLPSEEGARILQEDAWPLQRKVDQVAAVKGPFILSHMIHVALGKFAVSRSSKEVAETVKAQAEIDHARLVATMSTANYLAWAIPAIGFFGTVRGLAGSMSVAGLGGKMVADASKHLTIAFDCTLVALALSILVMFILHALQREEENLVIDCQQYCLEHLCNRIYEPESLDEPGAPMSSRPANGAYSGNISEGVIR